MKKTIVFLAAMATSTMSFAHFEQQIQLYKAAQARGLRQAIQQINDYQVFQLIDKGADLEAKSRKGLTALLKAALDTDYDDPEIYNEPESDPTELPRLVCIMRLLIENGANVKAKDYQGRTIFHRGYVFFTYHHIIRELIPLVLRTNNGDLKFIQLMATPNHKGATPIHDAAQYDYDSLRLFLETMKSVGIRKSLGNLLNKMSDRKHKTPLHYAIEGGDVRCVHLLLQHGADPLAKKHPLHQSPLEFATAKGKASIAEHIEYHLSCRQSKGQ